MPGPGPGPPPPPPASSVAGAWERLGVQAARGWRAGGGVRGYRRHKTAEPVSTPADWASPRAAALRAGDRRAGPWSAEASRRDSVTRGFLSPGVPAPPATGPLLARQPEWASRPDSEARSTRRTPYCTRLRAGSLEPSCARVCEHTRTVRATLGLQEPEATQLRYGQLPFLVPESPCGEGAVAKKLLAPLGDKNPNLRSHHAHSHARAHTLTHTHTLSPPPLPKGVSEEKARGPRFAPPPPPVFLRSSFYYIPLNRITTLIKRVILLIVTQEFFLK